jgi:large subunit ribosomal protein L19
MTSVVEKVNISPVNMKERQEIDIHAGDTVRVWIKIEEKGKVRLQAFEGTILATKHGNEAGATFTVRRVTGGIGVEKIFPLYSPSIDRIEILRRVKTRRAKLYYIRDKAAREIKRQMRKMKLVQISTQSEELRKKKEIEKAEAEVQAKEEAELKAKQEAEAKQAEEVAETKESEPQTEETAEAEQEAESQEAQEETKE